MPATEKPTIRIGTSDRNEKYVIAPANWLPSRSPYRVMALIRCLTLFCDAMRLPRSTHRPMNPGFSGAGSALEGTGDDVVLFGALIEPAMGPPVSGCTSMSGVRQWS